MDAAIESQLKTLREKVAKLRAAKELCQDFQLSCSPQLRGPMTQFYKWLDDQEQKATKLGVQLKESNSNKGV